MAELIRGAVPPAPTTKMEVFRVTCAETTQFSVVSERVFGQMVHWYGRRSHECTGQANGCEGCRENWPIKWKGYLHVVDPMKRYEGFLEITPACWQLLDNQIIDKSTLRGIRFRISKTKGGPKGRYLVAVLEGREPHEVLPMERDPLPVLRVLWRSRKQLPTQA